MKLIASEDDECKALVELVGWKFPEFADDFYHIPNGGSRHILEAKKLKLMGVKAGMPDYHLPVARGKFHGCYIEIKRKDGGKLQESQIKKIRRLRELGHYVDVASGLEDAISILSTYLNLKDNSEPAAKYMYI